MRKQIQFTIKGMSQDNSISKASNETSFENKNIRIIPSKDSSLLSITNEKGNREILFHDNESGEDVEYNIQGYYLGHCYIDKYLVLFTTNTLTNTDYIYKITNEGDKWYIEEYYSGNLSFNVKYPIEAIGNVEREDIVKVYWTDNINQLRMINILKDPNFYRNKSYPFESIPIVSNTPNVTIHRDNTVNGNFDPGVIQYVFTYYDKFSSESCIVYESPLYYISNIDRGVEPNKTVSAGFVIEVNRLDTNYEYLNIYSIHRTALDSTPSVKEVMSVKIGDSKIIKKKVIDNGNSGVSIDPLHILYLNKDIVSCNNLSVKDNHLFIGNYSIVQKNLDWIDKEGISFNKDAISLVYSSNKTIPMPEQSGHYPYVNQLSKDSNTIKTFKYNETYRFGIQFKDIYGRWSDPVFIGDKVNTFKPYSGKFYTNSTNSYFTSRITTPSFYYNLDEDTVRKIANNGYIAVRPVIVYPSLNDRDIICQGVLCPTVFNAKNRSVNAPFAQSSWFSRPNAPYDLRNAAGDKESDKNIDTQFQSDGGATPEKVLMIDVIKGNVDNPTIDLSNHGTWAEFRHNYSLSSSNYRNAEFQCAKSEGDVSIKVNHDFFVDQSIFTMHSPDIEFDTAVQNLDFSNVKLRIVGIVPITGSSSDIEITTSTLSNTAIEESSIKYDLDNDSAHVVINARRTGRPDIEYTSKEKESNRTLASANFYKRSLHSYHYNKLTKESHYAWKSLLSAPLWIDYLAEGVKDNNDNYISSQQLSLSAGKSLFGFVVYPFNRSGSLTNASCENEDGFIPSLLSTKTISNLKYSYNNIYFDIEDIWNADNNGYNGISGISIFNSDAVTLTKIPKPKNSNLEDINYYGNVDDIITFEETSNTEEKGYPIYVTIGKYDNGSEEVLSTTKIQENLYREDTYYPLTSGVFNTNYNTPKNGQYITKSLTSNSPISIKYKSTPHAVMAFNYTASGAQNILPTFRTRHPGTLGYVNLNDVSGNHSGGFFWDKESNSTASVNQFTLPIYEKYTSISGISVDYGWLLLGELYRDNVENKFGGNTQDAILNNQWTPAGEEKALYKLDSVTLADGVTVSWTEGDTYYQRYDHLKTYPFTESDTNGIVEIISFMCESRVNLDGRYDRNRGQLSNLNITSNNFNLLNPVYSQSNNFFNYRILDKDITKISSFNTDVLVSTEKSNAELVDSWTSINITSPMTLNSKYGKLESIQMLGNNLYAFQDRAISNILFNARVQIPTSDNTPIEITNGMKLGGYNYIITNAGCQNKHSIITTPSGIYYIDNLNRSINLFNGESNISLTDNLGFRVWISNNNYLDRWNSEDFGNTRTYYDRINKDVYFVNKDNCLVYSELLEQFTSFMDYNNVPLMININDKFISLKNNKLWEQNAGEYNYFFGEELPKEYWIKYRVVPNPVSDKIFSNIEFRADTWNNNILTKNTFNIIRAETEYQDTKEVSLKSQIGLTSNLKSKFRIWRAEIPRHYNTLDRIRNPWTLLTLKYNRKDNYKTELHDVIVSYFE